jgi:hypothetical protein
MRVVVETIEIRLNGEKVEEIRKRLNAIASTVDAGMAQINKNRRIKNLVYIVQRIIDEMVTTNTVEVVGNFKEVPNGQNAK